MNEWRGSGDDLEPVIDSTPVECIGGPNDGELLPVHENGARPNGVYVVVNEYVAFSQRFGDGMWRVVAKRYMPCTHDEDSGLSWRWME